MTLNNVKFLAALVSFAVLTGCGDPSDGNAEQLETAGSAGASASAGASGKSSTAGSAGSGTAGTSSNPSGAAGQGVAGEAAQEDPCTKVDCDQGEVCAIQSNGKAKCVPDPNGSAGASSGGSAGAGNSGTSGTAGSGTAGSTSGSAGTSGSSGSSGSGGNAGGTAGSAGSGTAGSAGSGSTCAGVHAGDWCAVADAGKVCGDLICNGVWSPNSGTGGSSGSAGAAGSAGGTAGSGSAGTGELVAGEVGEFSLTVAFKESGPHKLDLYAFESSGSFAWGSSPNVSATDTKITWKQAAHWGSYVELNGWTDVNTQLCDAGAATEPMWATFKRANGTVLPLRAAIAISSGGGCHLQYKLELCATDNDPDCDGKTAAQGDCDQSIGKGTASYPGALESANDSDDLSCDGDFNPTASELGQVYVQMTGMPHGVTAKFFDDLNWVDGGITMVEVSNGVYKTVELNAKPKSFYVTWSPTVNGKNSSAGVQGGICISNVSTVNVYNVANNTSANATAIVLDQNCHWSTTYN